MGVLLAKALAIAVIAIGPGPFPCGQSALLVRDGCAVAPNQVYVPTGGVDSDGRWVPFTPAEILNTRNHELGHIVDYNFLTNQDRGRFLALIGKPDRAWRSPPNSPHERFAEAFRLCAISTRYVSRYAMLGYGYNPTLRQHHKVCRWLATIGYRGATK